MENLVFYLLEVLLADLDLAAVAAGVVDAAVDAAVDAEAEWAVVLPNTEETSQGKTLGDCPKYKGHGLTN